MTDERRCGSCSLCCTVLRVDDLAKLGGSPCLHQLSAGGCRVHARRPGVCRAYRCAWLAGAFEQADRPDGLGAVLDLVPRGQIVHLVVRQADGEALLRSPRLREIVEETRDNMPVELRDVDDVLDADRPYRILYARGEEHRIEGERVRVFRDGRCVAVRRAPWPLRQLRRLLHFASARRLRQWPSHGEQLARLGLGGERLGGERLGDDTISAGEKEKGSS